MTGHDALCMLSDHTTCTHLEHSTTGHGDNQCQHCSAHCICEQLEAKAADERRKITSEWTLAIGEAINLARAMDEAAARGGEQDA